MLAKALNFIEFVGLSDVIEVRIGQCEDLVDNLTLGFLPFGQCVGGGDFRST